MKKMNRLGLTSVTLSVIGVLGYLATLFNLTRSGGHYNPSLMSPAMVAIFCAIGAVATGALGLRPLRVLNLIGLIIGVLLLMIPFSFVIIVMIFGL
ncbi:MAG: hypothetical protein ABIH70_03940 [Chloroflexota bacterium]